MTARNHQSLIPSSSSLSTFLLLTSNEKKTCRRLFGYRQKQPWPPTIAKGEGWDDLYLAAKEDLAVLPSADEAVAWANALIGKIAAETLKRS